MQVKKPTLTTILSQLSQNHNEVRKFVCLASKYFLSKLNL